jgi:hypothetical protein
MLKKGPKVVDKTWKPSEQTARTVTVRKERQNRTVRPDQSKQEIQNKAARNE